MPANQELLQRITARPELFGGKPITRDMRISVELILSLLSRAPTWTNCLTTIPDGNRQTSAPASPTPRP